MFRENELRNTQCWYFIVKKKKNNNIHTQKEIKEKTKINPKDKRFQSNYLRCYVYSTGGLTES